MFRSNAFITNDEALIPRLTLVGIFVMFKQLFDEGFAFAQSIMTPYETTYRDGGDVWSIDEVGQHLEKDG